MTRSAPARRTAWIIAAVVFFGLATLLDPWAYHHLVYARVYETDWGRALRTMGYWPMWMAVALAFWLEGRPSLVAAWRARALALSVTAAGLLDEVCKMLLRRERPGVHDGAYVFRPYTDRPFVTSGIGLPSSHAALSFAAAATLSALFPRTRAIWYVLALGCIVTRVIARAHFLSDVTLGAFLGILVGTWCEQRARRETFGEPALPVSSP